jgi:hypothetical protein
MTPSVTLPYQKPAKEDATRKIKWTIINLHLLFVLRKPSTNFPGLEKNCRPQAYAIKKQNQDRYFNPFVPETDDTLYEN